MVDTKAETPPLVKPEDTDSSQEETVEQTQEKDSPKEISLRSSEGPVKKRSSKRLSVSNITGSAREEVRKGFSSVTRTMSQSENKRASGTLTGSGGKILSSFFSH
jgi:hypothetical protein